MSAASFSNWSHPSLDAKMSTIPTSLTTKELLATSVVGAVVFPAVLGLGQLAVFKPLRLTHSSPVASLCGCVSVLAAGAAASLAAVQVVSLSGRWLSISDTHSQAPITTGGGSAPTNSLIDGDNSVEFGAQELLVSTVASAVLFRALGGRFSSVLPSHLLRPGAFAKEWIPVRATQATERQRTIIRELGRSHGCHSCGTRGVKQFHADHQPPTKLHNGGTTPGDNGTGSQRLYPQCNRCSSLQGAALAHSGSAGSKWSVVRTHPLSLRSYHLFLPIPLAVVYLKKSGGLVSQSPTVSVSTSKAVTAERSKKAEGKGKEREAKNKREASQEVAQPKNGLNALFGESNLPNLLRDFPLLIIWNRLVNFLDSFRNPGDAFHITILAFSVVAALGTI